MNMNYDIDTIRPSRYNGNHTHQCNATVATHKTSKHKEFIMSIITTIHTALEDLNIPVADDGFRTQANHARHYGKTHYATVYDEESGIVTRVSISRQFIFIWEEDSEDIRDKYKSFNDSEYNYSFTLESESEGNGKKPKAQYCIMTGERSKELTCNNGISAAQRVLANFLKKQAK